MGEYVFGTCVGAIVLIQFFCLLAMIRRESKRVDQMENDDEKYLDQLKKLREEMLDATQLMLDATQFRSAQALEKTTKQIDAVRESGKEDVRSTVNQLRGQFITERDALRRDFENAKKVFSEALQGREQDIRSVEQKVAQIGADIGSNKDYNDAVEQYNETMEKQEVEWKAATLVRIADIEKNLEEWKIAVVTDIEKIKEQNSSELAPRNRDDQMVRKAVFDHYLQIAHIYKYMSELMRNHIIEVAPAFGIIVEEKTPMSIKEMHDIARSLQAGKEPGQVEFSGQTREG